MTTASDLEDHEPIEVQSSGAPVSARPDTSYNKKGLRCAQCFDSKKGCAPKERPSGESCDPCIRSGFTCSGLMDRATFNSLTSGAKTFYKEKSKTRPISEIIADIDCVLYLKSELDESKLLHCYFTHDDRAELNHDTEVLDTLGARRKNKPDLSSVWKRLVSEAKAHVRQMMLSNNRGAEARFLSGLCAGDISYSTDKIIQDYNIGSELSAVASGRLFDRGAGLWFRWMKGYRCMDTQTQQVQGQLGLDECGNLFLDRDYKLTDEVLTRFTRLLSILGRLRGPDGPMNGTTNKGSGYASGQMISDTKAIAVSTIAAMSIFEELRPGILKLLVSAVNLKLGLHLFENEDMPGWNSLLHLAAVHSSPALEVLSPLVLMFPGLLSQTNLKGFTPLHCAAAAGPLLSLDKLLDFHHRTNTSDTEVFVSPEQIKARYSIHSFAVESFRHGFPATALMLGILESRWVVVNRILEFAESTEFRELLSHSGKLKASKISSLDRREYFALIEYNLEPIHVACAFERNLVGSYSERSYVASVMDKLREQTPADCNALYGFLDIMLAEDRMCMVRTFIWFMSGIDISFSRYATHWVQQSGSQRVKKKFQVHFPYPADYDGDRVTIVDITIPRNSSNGSRSPGSQSSPRTQEPHHKSEDVGQEAQRETRTEPSSPVDGATTASSDSDTERVNYPSAEPSPFADQSASQSAERQFRPRVYSHSEIRSISQATGNQLPQIPETANSPPLHQNQPRLRRQSSRTSNTSGPKSPNMQDVHTPTRRTSSESLASKVYSEISIDEQDKMSDLEMLSPPLSPVLSLSREYNLGSSQTHPKHWSTASVAGISDVGSSIPDQLMVDASTFPMPRAGGSTVSRSSKASSQRSSWSLGGMPFHTPRVPRGHAESNVSGSSGREETYKWPRHYNYMMDRDPREGLASGL